jgi:sulfofructose kinase
MTHSPAHVLCIGVAVQDNIFAIERFPAEPTKTFAKEFCQVGGGPAANGAVTVARLGGTATLWARIGDDAVGAGVAAELAAYGVDTSAIRRVPGHRTAVSAVMVDDPGERFIFAFAARTLPQAVDWLPRELPSGARALLCDVRWPAASEYGVMLARTKGLPVILDADLTNDDSVERLIPLVDHAVFSAPALRKMTGVEDLEEALRAAADRTAATVSVTRGGEGFSWMERGRIRSVPAFRVDVVDTLAAGDVFHGAFALGIAENRSTEEAGRFAAAAAALKCARWGGRLGIPTRDELDHFMARAA